MQEKAQEIKFKLAQFKNKQMSYSAKEDNGYTINMNNLSVSKENKEQYKLE